MNLYQLKKRGMLRDIPPGLAETNDKKDRHLTILTTAAIAFWCGLAVGWAIDWSQTKQVKVMQMTGSIEARK